MPEPIPPKPTERELAILRVLWDRGPSTVRQVHEVLAENPGTGYTTTLKFLQIMAEKGLVKRDEARRTHIYRAAHPREETQSRLLGDLLEKVFEGSARNLVMSALSSRKTSRKEIEEIRKLLDELEGGKPR
jgi:predicted transcriptional regulator